MIKGLLLIGSLTGWFWMAKDRTGLKKEFIPLTVFSVMSLLLYVGGLLHQLYPAAVLVYGLGLVFFLAGIWKRKKGLTKPGSFGLYEPFFFGVTAIFLILSFVLKLQHYDNFSHWAVVVKQMVSTDHFPTVNDTIISFKDYPVGTSVFLYYVCRMWSHGQGIMIFAQNMLLFAGFYAFFGMVRERRRFLVYTFIGMGCSMLSYLNLTIRINNLLVDFHLPVFALAVIAMIDWYQDDLKMAVLAGAPVLGYLTIIKSTGMIFAAFPLLYLVYVIIRKKAWKKSGYVVVMLVLMLIPYLLWNVHMKTELSGIEKKFDTNSQNEELLAVDASMHGEVIRDYVEAALDPQSRAASVFYFSHVVVIGVCLYQWIWKKRKLLLEKTLAALDVVILAYYGGILYMYLYMMPADEAVVLAGFERYACSIMVFFAGGLIFAGAKDIEDSFYVKQVVGDTYRAFRSPETKRYYQTATLVTVILIFNFLYSEVTGLVEIRRNYGNTVAGRVEQLVGDHWYQHGEADNKRYLVIAEDKDQIVSSYELSYTMKYFLYAPQVDVMTPMSEEELKKVAENYDQVITVQ